MDCGRLERQLWRLLGQNTPAEGRYLIEVGTDPTAPAGLWPTLTARPEWDD
jgi:hypothetical protein